MKNRFFLLGLILSFGIVFTSCKDDDDDDNNGGGDDNSEYTVVEDHTGTATWASTEKVLIDGLVFVQDGETLTIEPGTLIEAEPGQAENASALVVARGGYIDAQGTAENPIIFTAKGDGTEGNFMTKVRGLWGGIILLGKAENNDGANVQIEGISSDEPRAQFGGSTNDDNSGIMTYFSIRHGGTDIGDGNEINGLTLGSCGSGTTIDYVEVISNMDDGIEWFGGMPNVKHALVAYCGDDSFDYDMGYKGNGQFWVAVQDETSDRCGEHDGGHDNEETEPLSNPTIYNATYIGKGADEDGKMILFRDNTAGTYANSVFSNATNGLNVEYRDDKHCSYDMLVEGSLVIKNNVFNYCAGQDTATAIKIKEESGTAPDEAAGVLAAHFVDNTNTFAELAYGHIYDDEGEITFTGFVPTADAVLTSDLASYPEDSFFEVVSYKGAFEPGGNDWTQGWTLFSK